LKLLHPGHCVSYESLDFALVRRLKLDACNLGLFDSLCNLLVKVYRTLSPGDTRFSALLPLPDLVMECADKLLEHKVVIVPDRVHHVLQLGLDREDLLLDQLIVLYHQCLLLGKLILQIILLLTLEIGSDCSLIELRLEL